MNSLASITGASVLTGGRDSAHSGLYHNLELMFYIISLWLVCGFINSTLTM